MSDPVYFALIGDRRSGTTMLHHTLNQHPQIDLSGEIFNSYAAFDYWRHLSERKATTTAMGTLIHRWQAEMFPGLWDLTRGFHSRFICLYQENLLRQFCSESMAMITGRWQGRDPKTAVTRITVDSQALKTYVETRYRERAVDWQFQPRIEWSLERLTTDWVASIERMQQFLAVDVILMEPAVEKIESRSIEEIVSNYEEVVQAVSSLGHPEWLE